MKIKYVDGCADSFLEINGKEFETYTPKEQREVSMEILKNVDIDYLREILYGVVERLGVFEDSYECKMCGDSVYVYKMEL